jgi:hypothetical protein
MPKGDWPGGHPNHPRKRRRDQQTGMNLAPQQFNKSMGR